MGGDHCQGMGGREGIREVAREWKGGNLGITLQVFSHSGNHVNGDSG